MFYGFGYSTNAPGWKPKLYPSEDWDDQLERFVESPMKHQSLLTSDLKVDANSFEKQLRNGLENLLKEEPKITHYDTLVGDGDCGETLAAGANSILKALKENSLFKEHLSDPIATLSRITEFVEDSMGGTSGGIYSIYLTALVQYLKLADKVDSATVANAFTRHCMMGCSSIQRLELAAEHWLILYNLLWIRTTRQRTCRKLLNLHAKVAKKQRI